MLKVRKSEDRGVADFGWLHSQHTFSFGSYYDPKHTGIGPLRAINEDRVQPGHGFESHGRQDMEIISFVLEGSLEHKDSIGNGAVLRCGDVQRMSAGSGVVHSEYNHSPTEPVHLLQIWIEPNTTGGAPEYEGKHFCVNSKQRRLRVIASPDGRDGSLRLRQDAYVFSGILKGADEIAYPLPSQRNACLHVVRGCVQVNGVRLSAGDGAQAENEARVLLTEAEAAEVLFFDLPY
jgi:redox-sensitive bicupin YhaK (pirin superfamily)